jgi:hypothetical protein
LFARALDRYFDRSARALTEDLRPPKQAIRSFFGEIIERSASDCERRAAF